MVHKGTSMEKGKKCHQCCNSREFAWKCPKYLWVDFVSWKEKADLVINTTEIVLWRRGHTDILLVFTDLKQDLLLSYCSPIFSETPWRVKHMWQTGYIFFLSPVRYSNCAADVWIIQVPQGWPSFKINQNCSV